MLSITAGIADVLRRLVPARSPVTAAPVAVRPAVVITYAADGTRHVERGVDISGDALVCRMLDGHCEDLAAHRELPL